ncbi:MAG: hypothetical protein PHG25_00795 [Candidatus Pacebacteria bacterium]|nr:hypothetical protein [Candidatus Paceibacterota bacterium]
MNKTQSPIVQFGTVQFWNEKDNFGRIIPDGWKGQQGIPFTTHAQKLRAGNVEPEFVEAFFSGKEYIPRPHDRVVFTTAFGKLPCRSGNGSMLFIKQWGYAVGYQELVLEIAHRPQFRIVRDVENENKIVVIKEVASGSLEQLVALSPRDGHRVSNVDLFASVYVTHTASTPNRWQRLDDHGQWVNCVDPRPFPAGELFRFMLYENNKWGPLEQGTALELQFRSARGSKKDRFAPIQSQPGEPRKFTWWEKQCEAFSSGKKIWVEIGDPRPEPVVAVAKPCANDTSVKTASPAPAKYLNSPGAEKRPKEQVFKGFDALDSLKIAV